MLSSLGEANTFNFFHPSIALATAEGTYSSAIALATEEAHFRHLRHFRTLHQRRYVLI